MGCSAGKHVATSPELSNSTHISQAVTALPINKENGWPKDSGLVDEPNTTYSNTTVRRNSKKDSTPSSQNSAKELDMPDTVVRTSVQQSRTKSLSIPSRQICEKSENGVPTRKHTPANKGNEDNPPRAVPLGQPKVQMTQSQTDFFTMLDRKIEAGEDYISDSGER